MIRVYPILMPQEIMYLVRIDQLLEVHAVRAQSAHEVYRLRKLHVAIVVAVDQQHWRFPFVHRRNWRRLARQPSAIHGVRRYAQAGDIHTPIVQAVKINSRGEDV